MSTSEFEEQCLLLDKRLLYRATQLTSNLELAKDLLQTTKLLAFDNIEKYEDGTNFKAWIKKIMYNKFVSEYRRQKKQRRVIFPMTKEAKRYFYKSLISYNSMENKFLLEDIKIIIQNLKQIYQYPFILWYRGYSYKEVSSRLNVPIGTIKSRIYTAKRILRKKIIAKYGQSYPLK